jgi:hypothetical protein
MPPKAAWPLAAGAQQAGKLRNIGFLSPSAHSAANEWVRFGAATARRRDLAHKRQRPLGLVRNPRASAPLSTRRRWTVTGSGPGLFSAGL